MNKNILRRAIRASGTALPIILLAFISFARSDGSSNAGGILPPLAPACVIQDSKGRPVLNNSDALAKLLLSGGACPVNVFEFRARLLAGGAKIKTALVANRGFHNASSDSFSMFEMVSGRLDPLGITIDDGDFFFGHFTASKGVNTLFADQRPESEALMIELIAWDTGKQVFNFYEMLGDGRQGKWFYRGDSLDIQADVKFLHRQTNPNNPRFGSNLRCSGCHTAGGPIMKELVPPYNDWWINDRHLSFGKAKPDAELSRIFQGLVDASELSNAVRVGVSKLFGSAKFQQARKALSLQEQLRPLFCPVELNLESDFAPLDQKAARVQIPSAFFVNIMLAQDSISIERSHYDAALVALKASFPETLLADADHGWLTPVKAFSDTETIESLIKQGLIDKEFAIDVLAVDMTNPIFSTARASLLRLLPDSATGDWKEKFKANLKANASRNPAAQELLNNLTDQSRDIKFHQARALRILSQCQKSLQEKSAALEMYKLLAQRRAEAFASEISKNPKGQILEPGFRVIFPKVTPAAKPGFLRLNEDGQVVR
ncbi:MAG TPA: hypothetical protein VLR90_21150 [Blastocatellia bacterium]|nr:hypothetical protein [Blastocatellia bacterium]